MLRKLSRPNDPFWAARRVRASVSAVTLRSAFVAVLLVLPACAWAQWHVNGVVLTARPAAPSTGPAICSDGAGGAYVSWRDERGADSDIYLQRVLSSGVIAPGWPLSGAPVCTAVEYQAGFPVPDGAGGAFIGWIDYRNNVLGTTRTDVFVHRILPSGVSAPGWPTDGLPLALAPGWQENVQLVADGAGGAFATWEDYRHGGGSGTPGAGDVYAQHVTSSGSYALGWPVDGLPVCTSPAEQGIPHVVADGTDGALIAFGDNRPDSQGTFVQHLLGVGIPASGWPVNGLPMPMGRVGPLGVLPDDSGGIYLACGDGPPYPYAAGSGKFVLQRVTGSGALHTGWPSSGALIAQAVDLPLIGLRLSSDGLGGVLLAWSDYRNYSSTAADVYALRIRPDGTRAPGWPAGGIRVTNLPGWESAWGLAPDGHGGAYITFTSTYQEYLAFIQHLAPDGQIAEGWMPNGRNVMDEPYGSEYDPVLVSDGAGGAIVAWESRNLGELRARRFAADGPVATALALLSVDLEPDAVRLMWHGPGAANLSATVERRLDSSPDWAPLASITADASDRFSYEDRSVRGGSRYGYRLRWREDGAEQVTNETWVDVPSLTLALHGLRPNPAVGDLTISFVLPSAAPARLELIDVTGRQRLERKLAGLGAGRHTINLGSSSHYEPGVYWVRLVHGDQQRLARGLVVR